MTFLALNGTTVRTRSDAVQQKDNEHRLDRERMFDGTMRLTRGGVFRQWDVTTAFLSESDANTLLALVRSGGVLTASGDLVGDDVAVMPVPGNDNPKQTGDGFRRQITFTLHETGGPLPADTSAPLGAFWRGGAGYRTGTWGSFDAGTITDVLEGLDAAGEGDPVSAWLDQSGHRRHWMGGIDNASFNSHTDARSPTVLGTTLRFGESSDTNCRILQTTAVDDWWQGLTHGEVMIAFLPTDDSPVSDGKNLLWGIGHSGAAYPDDDGHLYDSFLQPGGGLVDLGASTIDFSSMQVMGITVDTLAASPNFVVRFGNVVFYSATEGAAGFPTFGAGISAVILGTDGGYGAGGYFDGIIKHMAVFEAPLTTSQRASWYAFMSGAVTDPPLP